ncbi:MAG: hypothetical protein ISR58_22050 [Anaerolineales bacterium]|nr:hypothetical protein [Chloroflexota bacterium]MBL6983877.1 hypothetical protein [Anaerolineales bacterium]
MAFQIGEEVIHLNHGLGKISDIEEKMVHGETVSCYVFQTPSLTVWVPIDAEDRHNLRAPKSKKEFRKLFSVLQSPIEPLSEDHLKRKKQLSQLMNEGQLRSICRIVRDLTGFGKDKDIKLSDVDKSILERATNSLLVEWVYSLSVPLPHAQEKMAELLNS